MDSQDAERVRRFTNVTSETRNPPTRTCCVSDAAGYSCVMLRCQCFTMLHNVFYLYVRNIRLSNLIICIIWMIIIGFLCLESLQRVTVGSDCFIQCGIMVCERRSVFLE